MKNTVLQDSGLWVFLNLRYIKMIYTDQGESRWDDFHTPSPLPFFSCSSWISLLSVDRTGYNLIHNLYMYQWALYHLQTIHLQSVGFILFISLLMFLLFILIIFFFCIFSPVTNKRFVLSQYLGGIKRNSTDHIVEAEAMSMSYGIKFSPELNENTGALVGWTLRLLECTHCTSYNYIQL